jgi:4'-phosphopantetheinyl transferase
MNEITWLQPQAFPILPDDTIHIWRSALNVSPEFHQVCQNILDISERERAKRFLFEEPSNRFTVSRGILRQLIGRYTQCSPNRIVFQNNAWGKPCLSADMGIQLQFNVTHTGDLALFAFSRNRNVGIDAEAVHQIDDIDRLVHNFFSDYECQEFQALPESQQLLAFFLGWTRKEAYIKGRGKGLSIPLNAFDVTLSPGKPVALLADRTDDEAVLQWRIIDIDVGQGYSAALAVGEGPEAINVCFYEYSGD